MTEVNHLRGVIWDLDGVLLDSHASHFRAWQQVTGEFGIPFSKQTFNDTFGMNNHAVLQRWLGARWTPELEAAVVERKESLYRGEARHNATAMPGARDWLARLHRAGWRQALGSSAPRVNIDVVLEVLGFRDYLCAISSGENFPSKPDPALFLNAARAMGVDPARCVVVEDAPSGIAGARAAGMRCIAVATTHDAGALDGADVIAPGLDALPDDAFDRLVPPL